MKIQHNFIQHSNDKFTKQFTLGNSKTRSTFRSEKADAHSVAAEMMNERQNWSGDNMLTN